MTLQKIKVKTQKFWFLSYDVCSCLADYYCKKNYCIFFTEANLGLKICVVCFKYQDNLENLTISATITS